MQLFHRFLANPKESARFYAKTAIRALYDEISLYPKPGLVSFIDSGAHQDMDGALFFRSLFGLRHYFFRLCFNAALGDTPKQLVALGVEAEQTMYGITKGINTHRGAIFALGILCSCLCHLSSKNRLISLDELQQEIILFWADYLQNQHQNINTHGAKVKHLYGVSDAKQMAIEGYQTVFQIYKSLAHLQEDHLFFGLLGYQKLLLLMDDINILYRVGPNGLAFARSHVSEKISAKNRETSIQAAIDIHLLFTQKNISPGGVADMISMLYFLTYLFKTNTSEKTQVKNPMIAAVAL